MSNVNSGNESNKFHHQKNSLVQVCDLTKQVANINVDSGEPLTILDSINFTILKAEAVAIVGPSGSGKSTLLGLLAGLDTPSGGRVYIDGCDIFSIDEDSRAAMRAQNMGFVFQSFQLLPSLTAFENVLLPMEIIGKLQPEQFAQEVLERVGLSHRIHHYPHQLSGGEQQRVAIARAFAPQPKILLADEPTGNLDLKTGLLTIDLLFKLNQELGTTLILVTHDQQLAQKCQRIIQLEGGKIVAI